MIKSITVWMIITIIGAVGLLGFYTATQTPATGAGAAAETSTAGGAPAAQSGASEGVVASSAALRALRSQEALSASAALDAAAQSAVVQAWFAPSSSAQSGVAILRPDAPPRRGATTQSTPDRASLRAPALQGLARSSERLDATALLLDTREGDARPCDDAAACGTSGLCLEGQCVPVLASPASDAELVRGAVAFLRTAEAPFHGVWEHGGALYDVHAAPTASEGLWGLSARPLDAARVDAYASALGGAATVALIRDDAVLHTATPEGAPAASEDALLSVDAAQDSADPATGLGGVSLTATSGSPAALAIFLPGSPAAAAAAAPGGAAAPAPAAGPMDVIADLPNHPVPLALTGVGVLLIGLLFGFITRREARDFGPIPADAGLTHAADLEAEGERVPRAELELAQNQLQSTRKKLDSSQERLDELETRVTDLQGQVTQRASELEAARAAQKKAEAQAEALRNKLRHAEKTSISDVVPAADADDLDADAGSDRTLVAERPDFLKTSPPPVKKKKAGTEEEYDTAEVSGEEMSQLLEEIEPPSEDLDALTDRLEGMSESEAAQLDAASPVVLAEDAPDSDEIDSEFLAMVESFGDELDSMLGGDDVTTDSPVVEDDAEPSPRGTVPGLPRIKAEDIEAAHEADRDTLADAPPAGTLPLGMRRDTITDTARRNSTTPGMPAFKKNEGESKPTAPPPWKSAGKRPASSSQAGLSPASLLEALKRRGQSTPGEPAVKPTSGPLTPPKEDTKISPVTRELLEKSKRKAPRTVSRSGLFSRTGSKVGAEPASDTEYFKSLYEEFLATKEKCGESTDNITLERFVNRLARNKQALMERYDCRTVRFQVYVKEGRAALKATPVK